MKAVRGRETKECACTFLFLCLMIESVKKSYIFLWIQIYRRCFHVCVLV